ncbi:hypothetical protein GJAV_G00131790 [Gymnothorax javanicus]|nr:hypothetical protein GJAV_G00131790 [Gymnothorax javanicus]
MIEQVAKSVEFNAKEIKDYQSKTQALEKKVTRIETENVALKGRVLELERYKRRWNLKLRGFKEQENENTREWVLQILLRIAPHWADKIDCIIDSVHRLGKREEAKHRQVIIQFTMRHYRDELWRLTKRSAVCNELNCLNLSPHVFTLGASVVVNGHVHKLLTYPFFNEDVPQLLLSACVLLLFCSSLEKSLGTVRLMYLQLLLCMCTGLTHTLLELLLFSVAEQSHVQGFIPVSLALLGMATVHSPMRKAVLLGVSVPTPVLPWIFLLFTLIIPDAVFLCNAVAILLGEIYGMGWFSLLDLSEARASVLDKKMPFRQLRMLVGALYIPASIEERRKTQDQPCNPPPGSYPVQAYAPASSVPSRPLTDGLPQMYEVLPALILCWLVKTFLLRHPPLGDQSTLLTYYRLPRWVRLEILHHRVK